jgi:hypothetical protein
VACVATTTAIKGHRKKENDKSDVHLPLPLCRSQKKSSYLHYLYLHLFY